MDENELIQRLKRGDRDARHAAWTRYSPKIEGYVRKEARIRVTQHPESGRLRVDDSDVKDIVSEAFYQFFRDVSGFRGRSSLETYLHSIARKRTIDFYRAYQRNNPRLPSVLRDSFAPDGSEPMLAADSSPGPTDDTFNEHDLEPEDILRAPNGRDNEKRKAEQRLRREAHAVRAVGRWHSRETVDAMMEVNDALGRITGCQREVVTLRLLQGLTTKQTADVLDKDEGAVKMALFRGLQALGEILRHDKEGEKTEVILHD